MTRLNRLFFSILLAQFFAFGANAQVFGNEWINYSQTYAKVSLYQNGIYRITNAELVAAGISNANGANLQIFRDGSQVPIYVSNNGGFGSADYIEFYGEMANGKVDEPLFLNPNDQMNKSQNLISDTAYYFITQSTAGPSERYTQASNVISGNPTKEPYVWDAINRNYRGALSQGPSYIGQSDNPINYIRSSQFEQAEGWVNTFSFNPQTQSINLPGAYKNAGAPNFNLKTTVAGFSYLPMHRLEIKANGNLIADSQFSRFSSKEFNLFLSTSNLTASNQLSLLFTPLNSQPGNNLYDRIGVANIYARYARNPDFSGFNSKYFELDPKVGNYYLEIDNFDQGGAGAPWLYDLEDKKFYEADISLVNKLRFLIPANSNLKRYMLVGRQTTAVKNVNSITGVSFKNYSNSANQGDYVIITDPYYYDGNGQNYVEDYRVFRTTALGGNFSAITAEVEDIYNEFGYGYPFHAQAIRNFLHYSHKSSAWTNKSKYAFLIGKGILYASYLSYTSQRQNTPAQVPYVPIPTFGVPASDIMLTDFNNDNIPELPIGRLSILNGEVLGTYLEKAQLHEARMANTNNQFVDSVLWQKQILHVAGADDINVQAPILNALNRQGNLLRDTAFGAIVSTFAKSSTAAVQQEATEAIDKIVNQGAAYIQFFGHGSLSTLDFGGFDNPNLYNANNRFSIFMANGCGVGNVFGLGSVRSLSESWIEEPNKGSVGYIANSNTGYLYYLANYTDSLYKQMGQYEYGKSIGKQFVGNVANVFSYPINLTNHVLRLHAEQILLQGDPAISMFGYDKPDYAIEEKYTKIRQLSITTKLDSFDVDMVVYNLGKYTRDSVDLQVSRVLPNNITQVIYNKRYPGIAFTDSLSFRVAVGGKESLGNNKLIIKIDNASEIDEVAEYNNEINKSFAVYNDDLEPIYPYDFSIVTQADITLKASTLNPFLDARQYVIQIDTTETFDSPNLLTNRITSTGGVVKWKPVLTYSDSTVYYWRTAMDTLYGNDEHRWTASSFIYLPSSTPGWNQSHFYQYKKDNFQNLEIDSTFRDFKFTSLSKKLQVQNACLYGPNPYSYSWADYTVKINGVTLYTDGCDPWPRYESLQFVVIDSLTGLPWENTVNPNNPNIGLYGSWKPCRNNVGGVIKDPFFEFGFYSPSWRQTIMDFIDSIPNGTYMMIQPRLCVGSSCGGRTVPLINHWMSDTASLGSGNSLYHKIKNIGFTEIDSLYKNRSMMFFMQKGNPNSIEQHVGIDSTVKLYREFNFNSYLYEGKMISNKIGPAKTWDNFNRSGFGIDNGQAGDTVLVEIYGVDNNENETLLATVAGDTSLSFIDANVYPELRLAMNQSDNNFSTPEQVRYWRVHYTPLPEAALNPNIYLTFIDTLGQGQQSFVEVAIENLTELPMDSMLVKYSLIDKQNNETILDTLRFKPLSANDTIHTRMLLESKGLSGSYFLRVEANPYDDQPEQYHPNNIGLKEFFVSPDLENPILDVTFDGIHILNRDIVSAKPSILISLKDENKFLTLDDTTSMTVSLRYPDNPNVDVPVSYSDPNLTFIPADPNNLQENKARIEFKPTFLKDGIYELIVNGKDKSGNISGNVDYKVAFNVVTKSSITSMLNYPNPFSTSTQFVFTLTGSEVPEQFKIVIYSVSGKVVREISKAEIGNIHIGRNITEFRWKGEDQYGEMLGNGVYLYRVITRLNGQEMDKAENDGASQWTTKGFGKLYLMR